MIHHLMQVPPELWTAIAQGSALVDGSLVKDAVTKQILAHLQPSGQLTSLLTQVSSGPAGVLNAVSSLAGNVQLTQIKGLIQSLQLVAEVGAAASVLNLGVSIGGFAVVLSRLRSMDAKLDGIASQLDAVARTLDTEFRARGYSALNRAESAFELSSPAERKRYWQEAEKDLDFVLQHSFQRLVGIGLDDAKAVSSNSRNRFFLASKISGQDARDALHWLLGCAGARVEMLLCLEEPRAAAMLSEQIHKWMTGIQFTSKELAQAGLGDRIIPPAQIQIVTSEARGLSMFLSRSAFAYGERTILCRALYDHQVDTQKYVMDVRNHPEPAMLMLQTA